MQQSPVTGPVIGMVRPTFPFDEYHRELWRKKDITVLICQRNTPDLIRLSLESLLQFYPDIPVLVVDGNSQNESILYLRLKSLLYPNVRVWERPHNNGNKYTSHGITMHDAITTQITTKYILLLDSDTIVERGGWIDLMLDIMHGEWQPGAIYALGSLMLMGRKSEATLPPEDENDVLPYAHPSCSLIDRELYLKIAETYTDWPDGQKIRNIAHDHGSPLVWNMMGAEKLGLKVEYFAVDKYVSHLSGASWQDIPTLWPDGHNVIFRPFVTFIANPCSPFLHDGWKESDYDVVFPGESTICKEYVIHGEAPFKINGNLYNRRLSVRGEYICDLSGAKNVMTQNVVKIAKELCVKLGAPDIFESCDVKFIRRRLWQRRESLGQQQP